MKYIPLILLSFTALSGSAFAGFDSCTNTTASEKFCTCQLSALHPTQKVVGMIEVGRKEREILTKNLNKPKRSQSFWDKNAIPTVIGPNGVLYPIDHHHLSLALLKANITDGVCKVVSNFSDLTSEDFWGMMKSKNWVYLFDENGKPIEVSHLPEKMMDLVDDSYRSLAGIVRKKGGIEKVDQPYAEFLLANFLRTRITLSYVGNNFDPLVIEQAIALALSPEASSLPGHISERKSIVENN